MRSRLLLVRSPSTPLSFLCTEFHVLVVRFTDRGKGGPFGALLYCVAVNRTITVAGAAARVSPSPSCCSVDFVGKTEEVSFSLQPTSNPCAVQWWRQSERAGMVVAAAAATRRTQNTDADFKHRDERLLHTSCTTK